MDFISSNSENTVKDRYLFVGNYEPLRDHCLLDSFFLTFFETM